MNSNAEILDHFRDEYLSYLEGDRDNPPFLPTEVHHEAVAFVKSITAARGVDPYASRPSIEQLLAKEVTVPKCRKCEGDGRVADTDEQEPWSAWTSLPLQSSIAVLSGVVQPIPCPDCGGSGETTKD